MRINFCVVFTAKVSAQCVYIEVFYAFHTKQNKYIFVYTFMSFTTAVYNLCGIKFQKESKIKIFAFRLNRLFNFFDKYVNYLYTVFSIYKC